jgi:hypothetical protein
MPASDTASPPASAPSAPSTTDRNATAAARHSRFASEPPAATTPTPAPLPPLAPLPVTRGLHSSTARLNVSAFSGKRGAIMGH